MKKNNLGQQLMTMFSHVFGQLSEDQRILMERPLKRNDFRLSMMSVLKFKRSNS